MNFSELSRQILAKCPEILKSAFQPVEDNEGGDNNPVEDNEGDDNNPVVTKFGGADPFRASNFQWPKCAECEKQKTFICQINISSLPKEIQVKINRSDGLFQCFYCLDCMPYDGCFDDIYFIPRSDLIPSLQSLVSKFIFHHNINTARLPEKIKSLIPIHNEVFRQWEWEGFEEKKVERWVELKQEIPSLTEIAEESEHKIISSTDISQEELDDMEEDENSAISFPHSGIKLGGYVRWCQGVEYPICPDCKVMMTITFLQLERSALFPFVWGDSGTAHVTLCPGCGRPGLGWACC